MATRRLRAPAVPAVVPAALGVVAWLSLALWYLGVRVGIVPLATDDPRSLTLICVFFGAHVTRLALGAASRPGRRIGPAAMAAGMLLWCLGSLYVASDDVSARTWPTPAELFFASCYAAVTLFLFSGQRYRANAPLRSWLDALVTCGGTLTLASATVVSPLADGFPADGAAMLLCLLYPILDLILLMIVVGQAVFGLRRHAGTLLGLAGLVALLIGDATMTLNLRSGGIAYGGEQVLCWMGGFSLLAESALIEGRGRSRTSDRGRRPMLPGALEVAISVVTAVVLARADPHSLQYSFLVLPALGTLFAAALRMLLALREAHGAAEAYRLSKTDDLTELPNRRAVIELLGTRLEQDRPTGLMLLDLDGFKEVNDTLGHAAGDTVLRALAERLRAAADPRCLLAARLGGDEFALVTSETDEAVLVGEAERLVVALREPMTVEGLELSIGASVGVAAAVPGAGAGGDLLRRADVAMYLAKNTRQAAARYDVDRDAFSRRRLLLIEELRHALEHGGIEVWYQPQVSAGDGRVRSVEALVRWNHPVEGMLLPGSFLADARRGGLMPALSEAVIGRATQDAARWAREGLELAVAVNLSPAELLAGPVLDRLLERARLGRGTRGASAAPLVVEVTEETFLADPERALTVIERIRAQGIEVSIDDYGTGFSSLAYLRDLPVQELKLDRSFVSRVLDEPRSRIIVASTLEMCRGLGLRTVAEGVEEESVARALAELGVDLLQGYHLGRPMPAETVPTWVRANLGSLAGAGSHAAQEG